LIFERHLLAFFYRLVNLKNANAVNSPFNHIAIPFLVFKFSEVALKGHSFTKGACNDSMIKKQRVSHGETKEKCNPLSQL
jgi:hypothetical protein